MAVVLLNRAAEESGAVNYITVTGILLADAEHAIVSQYTEEEGTRLLMACASPDERDPPGQINVRVITDRLPERGMQDLKAGRQVLVSGHLAPGGAIRASIVMAGAGDLVGFGPAGERVSSNGKEGR